MASLVLVLMHVFPVSTPDTIVVCPGEFRHALQPWQELRQDQGHRLEFISNQLSALEIRNQIRQRAKDGQLQFVVLVGDALPPTAQNPQLRSRTIPTHHVTAKVNIAFGSEQHIGSDNWYADLDDDELPDLAIGRLTADSPQELSVMIQKIMAHETCTHFGLWRRHLDVVAGVGGFGSMTDMVLEMVTKRFLTDAIPASYSTHIAYGSWRSPYCPDPRSFRQLSTYQMNRGGLFWVYLGHGERRMLDHVRVPGGAYPIFDEHDVVGLDCQQHRAIAILLSCYAGAFDEPQDCLGELLLRHAGGPVAVLAGSRVTMPYGMASLAAELLDQYFQKQQPTLGELLLHAKRLSIPESSTSRGRQMVDMLASTFSPTAGQLPEERREHLFLINLFGDPLLRLRHPKTARLETAVKITAGKVLQISGTSPITGTALVELVCRRDRMTFDPPQRPTYQNDHQWLASFNDTYLKANNRRWNSVVLAVDKGPFEVSLPVPAEVRGPCHARLFIQGKDDFATATTDLFVRKEKVDNPSDVKISLDSQRQKE